ncbi:MAG: VOC family protein [Gemmatimonadetes bacterium]|nr:VOC family protein [Gemmatimonadota bacterium]
MMSHRAHLRVARPTGDLEAVARMYREGFGFEELGSFRDHDGFDGIMLGHPGHPYHLELTHEPGSTTPVRPAPDQLLVFYLPDRAEWDATCHRVAEACFKAVPSHNPYWDVRGRTFEDSDGYRVVLQNAAWP